MRKIKLDMEALEVESFVTAERQGRATVGGHVLSNMCQSDGSLSACDCQMCPTNGTCLNQNTCYETCNRFDNDTCAMTCGITACGSCGGAYGGGSCVAGCTGPTCEPTELCPSYVPTSCFSCDGHC